MSVLICHTYIDIEQALETARWKYISAKVKEIVPQLEGSFNVDQVVRLIEGRPRGELTDPPEPFSLLKVKIVHILAGLDLDGETRIWAGGRMYLVPRRVK